MKINDGIYQLRRFWDGVLKLDPLLQGSQVVPKVWHTSGLNARENDLLLCWLGS